MEQVTVQILLTFLEILCFVIVFFLYSKNRRQRKNYRFESEKLSEILSTSPAGYFYFLTSGAQVCSRRLAVILGIYEANPSFEVLQKKLSAKSQRALQKAVTELTSSGKEFAISVATAGENIRLKVQGIRATTIEGRQLADVLWFQDETQLLEKTEIFEQQLTSFRRRDELFFEALDGLPFALWLRNADLSLAYCNKAYLKLARTKNRQDALDKNIELSYDAADKMGAKLLAIAAKSSGEGKQENGTFVVDKKSRLFQVNEIPLVLEKAPDERFTLGFTRDIQNEQTLKTSLENYLKAQYQVLGALSSGIVIFDANGYVQFYNKAFCDLWKLPEEWLMNAPSFAGILEKLREKRLLPEEGDFVKYKHKEIEAFSTLTSMQEDFLYLPSGLIYKRTMNPYPLGGVVMTFDDVSDKVSMERQYNTQLANQQRILNEMPEGLLIFNEEGRLTQWNTRYEELFKADRAFLKSEPLLIDVLDSQKPFLTSSDDIWDLLKQKILLSLETPDTSVDLELADNQRVQLKMARLADSGMMLFYDCI